MPAARVYGWRSSKLVVAAPASGFERRPAAGAIRRHTDNRTTTADSSQASQACAHTARLIAGLADLRHTARLVAGLAGLRYIGRSQACATHDNNVATSTRSDISGESAHPRDNAVIIIHRQATADSDIVVATAIDSHIFVASRPARHASDPPRS